MLSPEFLRLLKQPEQRRQWLLMKALENFPFGEALRIAQAAELFLQGASASLSAGERGDTVLNEFDRREDAFLLPGPGTAEERCLDLSTAGLKPRGYLN